MADWSQVQQGLIGGYQLGKDSGGKLSGLGMALNKIASSMKEQRVMAEEQGAKKNLLGYEGIIKAKLAEQEGNIKSRLQKEERESKPTQEAIVDNTGNIIGYRPVGAVFQPGTREKGLTLSNALGILSDPMKARQLKRTYPKLYIEAENVIKTNLGEEVLTQIAPPLKNPGKTTHNKGKLPFNAVSEHNTMDTNW